MKFLNHLEVNENQLKNSKLYLATATGYTPTGGEGNLIYDTSDDNLKYWDGTNWITLMNSTGGATYTIHTQVTGGYNNEVGIELIGSNGTTDEVRIIGTNNETTVTNQATPNGIVVGLPDDVIIAGTLTVGDGTLTGNTVIRGNLTVDGTTTTVNSNTVSIGDNIIELNSDWPSATAPTQDAGILVNRGSAADVQLRYNETNNYWEFTNDGTNFCAIPCMSTGQTVLAYVKIYDDAGGSVSAATSNDSLVVVGGSCLTTTATTSTIPGGVTDAIRIDHTTLTNLSNTFADHDATFSTTLNWGDGFYGAQIYFDECGHRTRNNTYEYTLPAMPTTYPDQNIFARRKCEVTDFLGNLQSAAGGIAQADSTNDILTHRAVDRSMFLDISGAGAPGTLTDDVVLHKGSVVCVHSDIDKDSLTANVWKAAINHTLSTHNLHVTLWLQHSSDPWEQIYANVTHEDSAGNASTEWITVQFSSKPSADVRVVIHGTNIDNEVTPGYPTS